jgi:hypothetical protein
MTYHFGQLYGYQRCYFCNDMFYHRLPVGMCDSCMEKAMNHDEPKTFFAVRLPRRSRELGQLAIIIVGLLLCIGACAGLKLISCDEGVSVKKCLMPRAGGLGR